MTYIRRRTVHPLVTTSADPEVDVLNAWGKRWFNGGCRIQLAQIENVIADLEWNLRLPDFRGNALDQGLGSRPDDWFKGLAAFTKKIAVQFSYGFRAFSDSQKTLGAEEVNLAVFAAGRSIYGRPSTSDPIPLDWSNCRRFIDTWQRAIQADASDPHIHAMYLLAMGWDTYKIPLRFFTDQAACEWLNKGLQGHMYNLETYRKEVRGVRNGLSLSPQKPPIVKWVNPGRWSVNIGAAQSHGLILSDGF